MLARTTPSYELEEAVFPSGQELARRCGTNPSTVVRFSQKLGFAGYPAMVEALRHHLLQRLTPAARLLHLKATPEACDYLARVGSPDVVVALGGRWPGRFGHPSH